MPPAVFYVARQRFFDNSGVVVTLGLGVSAGLGSRGKPVRSRRGPRHCNRGQNREATARRFRSAAVGRRKTIAGDGSAVWEGPGVA